MSRYFVDESLPTQALYQETSSFAEVTLASGVSCGGLTTSCRVHPTYSSIKISTTDRPVLRSIRFLVTITSPLVPQIGVPPCHLGRSTVHPQGQPRVTILSTTMSSLHIATARHRTRVLTSDRLEVKQGRHTLDLPNISVQKHTKQVTDVIWSPLTPSLSPRPKAAYHCLARDCTYQTDRLHDLKRHKASKHDTPEQLHESGRLIDCPYHGCGHTGKYGFKRKDHLRDHTRRWHKRDLPKKMGGTGLSVSSAD